MFGLTDLDVDIMKVLGQNGMNIRQVGKRIGKPYALTYYHIRKLDRMGLTAIARADGREKVIVLTPKGETVLKKIEELEKALNL